MTNKTASKKHSNGWKIFRKLLFITIGAFLFSLAIEGFLVPNKIIDGGVAGISMMTSHLTGIPLNVLLFGLNLPFIYLGYKQIGKSFALYTLYAMVIMFLSIQFLHNIPPVTDQTLLNVVFGGIILGIGVGLVIRNHGSLDGTEILAILFTKKMPFSVGQIVMFFNLFILSSASFVFGLENALYSLITYYISYKVIDLTIEGLDENRSVNIISDKSKEIAEAILHRLGRGVTFMKAEGAYTKEEKKVIYCVITRLEETKLKEIVAEIDDHAFIAIAHINEVSGGHFIKKDIH